MKNYKYFFLSFLLIYLSCSKEDEIRVLKDTIIGLQNNISQLNTQIIDFENKINQLISQNNLYSDEIYSLNNQLNDFEYQIQEYIEQIDLISESNEVLADENAVLTLQISNLQEQLYNIEAESAVDGLYLFNKIEIQEPLFRGSLWELPDLIKSSDYSVYSSFQYFGIEQRLFYDQNIPDYIEYPAHVMRINFGDGLSLEFEIYSEFTYNEAISIKDQYAPLIGQLGRALREHIKSFEFLKESFLASAQRSEDLSYSNITIHPLWIDEQVENFSGGNRVEELLIHEAAHLSIDPFVYNDSNWDDAVSLDGNFISNYAQEYPNREDIAETFQAYIAVKYFPDRISNSLRDSILSVCLNRFKYFDSMNLDLSIYK